MSLLTLGIYVAGLFVLLGALVVLLPNGTDYPLSPQFIEAIQTLYAWLYSFNNLFPVDTLVTILALSIFLEFLIKFVWKGALWIIHVLAGSR